MKPSSLLALVMVLGLLAAACDSDDAELSTTTSALGATTEASEPDPTTTTAAPDPTTTRTTLVGETVTGEVVERISTEHGEVIHVVIPPGAYTDVDLVNLIGDLKEADPELWGAEIFDDPAGPAAFAVPESERTEEQQQTIDDHHFLTLTEGDRVIFRGPFSEFGEFILAS